MSAEQLTILPKRTPEELIGQALEYKPVRTACLFSGGNDSTVLAHRCLVHYDELMHIDTGTAVPGVLDFVRKFADFLGKPLRVYESGDMFRRLVLGSDRWWELYFENFSEYGHVGLQAAWLEQTYGQAGGVVRSGQHKGVDLGDYPHGFPGPGAHGRVYNRIKERQLEAYRRDCKAGEHRYSHVLHLSGKRRAESKRRGQTTKGVEKKGGSVYANPLIDWDGLDMARYRREFGLPQSDVAALLHRSGECNCGAFAEAAEERAMMKSLWPAWWAGMEEIEREAEARRLRWCRWGGYDVFGNRSGEVSEEKAGNLCSGCEMRLFDTERNAATSAGGVSVSVWTP